VESPSVRAEPREQANEGRVWFSMKGAACAPSRRWPLATASYNQTAERVGEVCKKIVRVEVARRLAEAIWHVLTHRAGRPGGSPRVSSRLTGLLRIRPRASKPPINVIRPQPGTER
jgi:hypothetical protein